MDGQELALLTSFPLQIVVGRKTLELFDEERVSCFFVLKVKWIW